MFGGGAYGFSRAPSEASTEAGGAFRFSYLNAAKAQEDRAPALRAAPKRGLTMGARCQPQAPHPTQRLLHAGRNFETVQREADARPIDLLPVAPAPPLQDDLVDVVRCQGAGHLERQTPPAT